MNEEIKKMAEELSDDYCEQYDDGQGRWCDRDCEVCRAERLYNAGYRKIVWHKVADGDLPKESSEVVLAVLEWLGILYYSAGVYTESSGWYLSNNVNENAKIIAWTELPTYEGER